MATFPQYIGQKPVPYSEAEILLSLNEPLACESAVAFLVASAKEVLDDPKVRTDIDKRLRSGSGIPKPSSFCDCASSTPVSLLDQLIRESLSSSGLERVVVNAVKSATITRTNVIKRGQQEGQETMDRTTDAFIRRKIWTESLVKEVVSSVQKQYSTEQSKIAKDGSLFALSSSAFGELQIPSVNMGELMSEGITVIPDFHKITDLLWHQLERLDALAVFDPIVGGTRTDLVYWSTVEGLSGELKELCEKIARLPYELNFKNKSLMLQVCQYFQISLFRPNHGQQDMHVDSANNGRKFTAIFSVSLSKNHDSVLQTKDRAVVQTAPGDLVILDSVNSCVKFFIIHADQMTVSITPVAVLRMAKHCLSNPASSEVVSGCLLGLDNDQGETDVTNVFVHPAKGAADFQPQQEEGSEAATFQTESIKLLKAANIDSNIVGWFVSSNLSSFVTESTVEIQFDYQSQNQNSVLIVLDNAFISETGRPLKAFRLTKEYLGFHKAMRDRRNQSPATLITGGPVMYNPASMRVFEEVEICVKLSILDEAFLFENRSRLTKPAVVISSLGKTNPVTAVQQLVETVEDLALEKVRFSQLSAGKVITGATRIRSEDEVKRLQSANDLILLTENVRRLSEHTKLCAKETELLCRLHDAISH